MSGSHRPWTEAELADLRARRARGETRREIARAHGRSVSSIESAIRNRDIGRGEAPPGDVAADSDPAVAEWAARRDAGVREVMARTDRLAEAFDWLRPVALPAPEPPSKPRVAATHRDLVAGDFHFPMQDDAACDVFVQAVAALRPRRVILNGDTCDLLAPSRYAKEARASKRLAWPLRDEVAAFHAFLHRLHSVGDAWGLEVVETNANHSGDGHEGRWWRYLNERCPELLGHDDAERLLSYQAWFYPSWSNIRLVDTVTIADDLLVLHGDLSRANAGYSARGHAGKWHSSLLHNHTHRMGYSPHRLPAIPGVRDAEGVVRAYENGCMCRVASSYATAPNWQNGFAIVTHHPAGEARYAVEQVAVINGRAVIGALGGELAA